MFLKGFHVGRNDIEISHLQYADDTIIFCPNQEDFLANWWLVIGTFLCALGLSLNLAKIAVIRNNVETQDVLSYAGMFGYKTETLPFSYLGIRLGGNCRKVLLGPGG